MFSSPGPSHPEHGTILDAIATAYETGSDESLKYAQARIAGGVRMSDPTPFMPDTQYDRYHEERLRMMRWLQNFGLRDARAGDEKVAIPGSMQINHAVRQQAREPHDATAFISQGNEKRNRGNYDGAIADFDRAIEIDPDNAGAYHGRGEAGGGKVITTERLPIATALLNSTPMTPEVATFEVCPNGKKATMKVQLRISTAPLKSTQVTLELTTSGVSSKKRKAITKEQLLISTTPSASIQTTRKSITIGPLPNGT